MLCLFVLIGFLLAVPVFSAFSGCGYTFDNDSLLEEKVCGDSVYTYEHDSQGRVTEVDGPFVKTLYTYTSLGYVSSETTVYKTVENQPSYTINYGYDSNGYLVSVDRPGISISYERDSEGRITKVTRAPDDEPVSIFTRSYYQTGDHEGRVKCDNCGDDATGTEVEYKYNSNGTIKDKIVEESTYTQEYLGDEPVSICGEDGSCSSFSLDSFYSNYARNSDGNIVYDGTYSYIYDSQGRVSEQWFGMPSDISLASSSTGALVSASSTDAQLVATFNYNAQGLLSEVEYSSGEVKKYMYDDAGNVVMIESGNETLILTEPGNIGSAVDPSELKDSGEKITLQDVLNAIQRWVNNEIGLSDVLNTINQWASL